MAAATGLDMRSIAHNAAAGLYGGIGLSLVGHPFETLKLRLQTGLYPTLGAAFRGTLRNEGLMGLYAGVPSPLALSMVFRGWLYVAFHLSRKAVSKDSYYTAGAITGFLGAFAESPMLLLMNQAQARPGTSVARVAKTVVTQYGIRGVYQGLGANIIRNIPSNSLYLGTFQLLRDRYQMNAFLAGSIGGVAYWIFTYPLDAVRGCMHADSLDRTQRKYASWPDAVRKLYAENGIKRFYKGYTPCLLRAVPANGTFFFMAEHAKAWLAKNF